jgi:proteasome lid subunit RPN8/RPN11
MSPLEEAQRGPLADTDPLLATAAEPAALLTFIAELEGDGFVRVGTQEWIGPTRKSLNEGGHTDSARMTIIIRPSWPYFPPLIHVPGIAAWHADQERLCLWQADDNSQDWATIHGLYQRIDRWAAHANAGFAIVENARNPEIYWEEDIPRAGALVEIEALLGNDRADGQHGEFHFAEARSADGQLSPNVLDLEPGPFTAVTPRPAWIPDQRLARGRWFYRSAIPHPPRDMTEFREFLTEKQRLRLDRDLRDRPVLMFGLLWHNEAGLVGTFLLSVRGADGSRQYQLMYLRPKGQDALLLRAGPDARTLQGRSVAIVGVGAIGSHLADQLARAGVGKLLLIDYDLLWPVNLIRHAAPAGTPAATAKTKAMKNALELFSWVEVQEPSSTSSGFIATLDGLRETCMSADLVVDATGHGAFAELASRVAASEGRAYVSVALFRGGAVARVRRQALPDDTPILQRVHFDAYPEILPLPEEAEYVGTETGCLAQVHNAPPVSVIHAAVLAAEVVIDHLTGRHDHADEVIHVVQRGDPPFHRLGRLRREDLPYTVDISERAQQSIRDSAGRALPNETGGVLVGCVIGDRILIESATEVRDDQASPTRYTLAEGRTKEIVSAASERDGRLGFVGLWHSHPAGGGPSPLDVMTMTIAATDSGTSEPVLVLNQPNQSRPDDMSAFVMSREPCLRPAALSVTGDLPQGETAST